jgi:DNA-binding transcriptional LysR family regulator
VPLTARIGRGTMLTEAGKRLAAGFRLALAELQAALDELAILGGRDQGAVRVGADAAALARLIPGAIARFLSEHPPVRIEVQAAGAADDAARLRDGRLDALITIAKPALDGLTAEPLIDDPLVIAGRAGHPLGGPATPDWLSWRALAGHCRRRDATNAAPGSVCSWTAASTRPRRTSPAPPSPPCSTWSRRRTC